MAKSYMAFTNYAPPCTYRVGQKNQTVFWRFEAPVNVDIE